MLYIYLGYYDYLCNSEIDECSSNPCRNGAKCVDKIGSFKCECPAGFSGLTCSTPLVNSDAQKKLKTFNANPCQINPLACGENGLCYPDYYNSTSYSSNFTCVCLPGYTGASCTQQIDYCVSNPCRNKATCQNMLGYYSCKCPVNYYGLSCEYFLQCSTSPCSKNGSAQCVDIPYVNVNSTKNYLCKCNPGYFGNLCESNFNECDSHPCQNNGTCKDMANGYTCACSGFYVGSNCEINYNLCQTNPCASGSTCESTPTGFRCLCSADLTGTLCEKKIDFCSSSPCLHGGLCQSGNLNLYSLKLRVTTIQVN